jgi:hypothetical protein
MLVANKQLGILQMSGFTWQYAEKKDNIAENMIYSHKYVQIPINGHIVSLFPYFVNYPINIDVELSIVSQNIRIGDGVGGTNSFSLAYLNTIQFIPFQRKIPAYITEFLVKVNQSKGLNPLKIDVPTWFPDFAKCYIQKENEGSEHTVS